jgi:glycine/D-amino acid oxidase-like deaminating enzyme
MKRGSSGHQPRVAVVGAGAFGGWTALHLRRAGAEVTLLDTWGPGNSRASSGDETRVIRSIYGPDVIYVGLVRRAFDLWREFERERGLQLYHRTGALWMFDADDAYARASLPAIAAGGLRVDAVDPAEAARRFPQIDLDDIERVYYEHEAGYLLARRACEAVVDAFVEAGGEYRQLAAAPGRIESGAMAPLVLADGSRSRGRPLCVLLRPVAGHAVRGLAARRRPCEPGRRSTTSARRPTTVASRRARCRCGST